MKIRTKDFPLSLNRVSQVKKESSIKINAIFNATITVLNALFPLITAPYLARVLTPVGTGTYEYYYSIVAIFTMVVAFGFTDYGTKEVSVHRNDKNKYSLIFSEIFLSRFIILAGVLSFYYISIFANLFGSDNKTIMLLMSLNIISAGIDSTFAYQGLEKFKNLSIRNFLIKVLSLILILIFVKTQADLTKYVLIMVSCQILQAVFMITIIINYISFSKIKLSNIIYCIKKSFIYFIPSIAVTLYTQVDKTMIGILSTKSEVGYYEQANKVITVLTNIVNCLSPILLARLSYLFKIHNYEKAKDLLLKALRIVAILGLPCTFGLISIANIFIPAFFGIEYQKSVLVSIILSMNVVTISTGSILIFGYFIPTNQRNLSTIFSFIAAFSNVGLNYILIPKYGAAGAAFATLIAETMVTVLNMIFSRKFINFKEYLYKLAKPFTASLIMAIIVYLFCSLVSSHLHSALTIIFSIVIGGGIYFGLLILLREDLFVFYVKLVFNKIKSIIKK